MRLAGFVIHGDAGTTLHRCLESLRAVCDDVVAVDSGSTDGSAELVRAAGARIVHAPWRGFGAARAAAVRALPPCDYVFFLDSDEWLEPPAREAIRRWRETHPTLPHYRLPRHDWADLPGGRFLYRVERHVRLVRRDAATWTESMIVHESLPRRATASVHATIEHQFATSTEGLAAKQDVYALLWAVRAFCEGRKRRTTFLRRAAHVLRDGVGKGALFRGGGDALELAWAVSRYHLRKHQLLRDIERGEHAHLVAAFRDGRLGELCSAAAAAVATAR